MRLPSPETATANTELPTLRVINGMSLRNALMKRGIPGKWLFHFQQGPKSRGHVASADM